MPKFNVMITRVETFTVEAEDAEEAINIFCESHDYTGDEETTDMRAEPAGPDDELSSRSL